MFIQLNNKYAVKSDATNYMLIRNVEHREQREVADTEIVGYFSTLEQLIKGLIEHNIKNSQARKFTDLFKEVKKIHKIAREIQGTLYLESSI